MGTKKAKRRTARRRLKAHTSRGENRHDKSAAYRTKAHRQAAERAAQKEHRKPADVTEPLDG